MRQRRFQHLQAGSWSIQALGFGLNEKRCSKPIPCQILKLRHQLVPTFHQLNCGGFVTALFFLNCPSNEPGQDDQAQGHYSNIQYFHCSQIQCWPLLCGGEARSICNMASHQSSCVGFSALSDVDDSWVSISAVFVGIGL